VLKKRKRKRSLDINCPGNKTEEDFQKKRKKKTKVWFYPKKDSNKSHRIQIFSEAPHSGTDQYGVTFSPSGGDEIAKDDDKNYEDHRRNEDKLKYCHDVSFLSKYTYSWYVKILRRGWQRPLEFMDLGRNRNPHPQCQQTIGRPTNAILLWNNPEGENPSLWRVLFMTYRKRLFYAGLWKLFGDVLNVVGPVVILPIVNYVRQIQEGTLVLRGEYRNKISFLIAILYMQMGISAVYGTVITVVTLIPLQFLLAKRMKIFNKLAENESDIRLKKTKEVIGLLSV
ncbi:hypothetical protein Avbf_02997, partial [Armadillidium vulgare]